MKILIAVLLAAFPFYGIPAQSKNCTVCACGQDKCVSQCKSDGKKHAAECIKGCANHDEAVMCMMPEDSTISIPLTHRYEEINDSYFDGKLPQDVIVHLSNLGPTMGMTTPVGPSFRIDLDLRWLPSPKEQEETLLHEVCHVSVGVGKEFDGHGPKWQACMHRLSALGAFEQLW
jgi:SprT-like family